MNIPRRIVCSFVALLHITGALAQNQITVVVPGTADPWLAGMPPGTTASCSQGNGRCDTVPANSPVLVSGLALRPGSTLSFTATGMAGYGPTAIYHTGPNGNPTMPQCHLAGAENGVPNFCGLVNALVGIFAGTMGKEIFLIGSSLTRTVPAGVNQLFLGMMDGYGWYDNSGAFTVRVTVELPDLVTNSLTWDTVQGGVKFQYAVNNDALATATTAKLFWANGTTTTAIIPGAPVIFTQDIPVGTSGLSAVIPVPAANFANPPATATHVLLVLDPDNLVSESDEGNNVMALALPDLAAVSFTWNTSQGGADFQYAINNTPLPQATTAKLYWAAGTNTSDIISANPPFVTPIYSMDIPTGSFGTTVAHFPASVFDSRPAGATHVLAVLDYDNQVVETDKSNNSKALALNLPVVVLVRGFQFHSVPSVAAAYWTHTWRLILTSGFATRSLEERPSNRQQTDCTVSYRARSKRGRGLGFLQPRQ